MPATNDNLLLWTAVMTISKARRMPKQPLGLKRKQKLLRLVQVELTMELTVVMRTPATGKNIASVANPICMYDERVLNVSDWCDVGLMLAVRVNL